jgi:hypothetical protein
VSDAARLNFCSTPTPANYIMGKHDEHRAFADLHNGR